MMKKLLLLLMISLWSLFAWGQIEKNHLLFGISADADFFSSKGASNVNIEINTDFQIAYFVKNKLALGAKLPFSYDSGWLINSPVYHFERGIAPTIQYYPFGRKNAVAWFVWAETGIMAVSTSNFDFSGGPGVPVRRKGYDWFAGGGIGLNAFITNQVAFTASAEARHTRPFNNIVLGIPTNASIKLGLTVFTKGK